MRSENRLESPVTTKRKADEEAPGAKRTDKRGRAGFTPSAATKVLKRTTPARARATMATPTESSSETQPDATKTMEKLFKDLGTSLTTSLTKKLSEDFRESMSTIGNKVEKNAESIERIQETIQRLERNSANSERRLEEKIDKMSDVGKDRPRASTSSSGFGEDSPFALDMDAAGIREEKLHDEQYELARRTLRLWPVNDACEDRLKQEVIRFLRQKLRVDTADCRDVDVMRVRKTIQARKASIKNEVAVVFLDKHVRDVVASHGKNLSAYVDDEGQPTAGMRLEYPSHLGRSFRDLEWYGREMRIRHGPGTRRNVKFNDHDRSLHIDICCLLYTSPSPRDRQKSRMPSSA